MLQARRHWVELEDLEACPAVLRDAATGYLRAAVESSGQLERIVPLVRGLLERTGTRHLVDLCSGGGGAVPALVAALRDEGVPATATLTDAFPNLEAFGRVSEESGGAVGYEPRPVDARSVPPELRGVRTLFNGLHHLRPEDAREVLASAARAAQPLCAVEFVDRRWTTLLATATLSPLAVWALMPRVRPLSLGGLLLTYAVPAVPLLATFDGVVSCLRVYSPAELRALADGVGVAGYRFEVETVKLWGPGQATVLLGWPESAGT